MKMLRILGLSILFIVLYVIGLLIIPSIIWLFGGSFLGSLQHPIHIVFGSIILWIIIGCLFHTSIDGNNFTFKD